MSLRKLFPLAVIVTFAAAPAYAAAEIPGVPDPLQQPAQQLQQQAQQAQQGLPRDQQDQVQGLVQQLPAPFAGMLPAPDPIFTDDLDGWIKNSLRILAKHGIPGSYEGIHRNIIRESGGNPFAINLWDSNAAAGIPSKGLLQVIDPTFERYHVEGTSWDIYDPVANITAACNYAAARYGSMDNVFGAY
ncbi:transglycosylase SLT domain-containing protein [Nocardia sp. NPDC050712]|uniref:transglycosylase SLT domain-containing protein n=1 Tax=Nocardia sp. NPDC050712 TaxID=3155518 RepID=UPI003402E5FF